MQDIKLLREKPKLLKKDYERRKNPELLKLVDKVSEKDEEYRKLLQETQVLRQRRNEVSKEINELKKNGKNADKQMKEAKDIPDKIKQMEDRQNRLKEEIDDGLMKLPNLMHKSVPYGKDDSENVEVRKWGEPEKKDFELVSHGELAERLGIADFKKAAQVSGAGFHYLIGDLALLNQAIVNYAVDFMTKKGYTFVIPPLMMNREAYKGCVDLSDFENVMYKIENQDLYLIATAEHPIAALHMGEVIDENKLPLKYVGYSPCFRKEIGAHGIDTKGLFRVHQFWKVEQFIYCKPENSWKLHEELQKNSEKLFQGLGLSYRIVNICTGDLGNIASKKYDLEVWMPRQNGYKEVGSNSNCTDYQARRLGIYYGKQGGEKQLVHTLNNTAIATSRAMVAILENFQNIDGSVSIPKKLQKYMGKEIIQAVK
jgi:seryl-tRNA synthetase